MLLVVFAFPCGKQILCERDGFYWGYEFFNAVYPAWCGAWVSYRTRKNDLQIQGFAERRKLPKMIRL